MGYELRISPQAIAEIDLAFNYYSEFSESAPHSFNEELNDALDILEENPHFQIRYGEIRALPFHSFPFLIFFTIEENIVNIHSVFHTAQNPDNYPKK